MTTEAIAFVFVFEGVSCNSMSNSCSIVELTAAVINNSEDNDEEASLCVGLQ